MSEQYNSWQEENGKAVRALILHLRGTGLQDTSIGSFMLDCAECLHICLPCVEESIVELSTKLEASPISKPWSKRSVLAMLQHIVLVQQAYFEKMGYLDETAGAQVWQHSYGKTLYWEIRNAGQYLDESKYTSDYFLDTTK